MAFKPIVPPLNEIEAFKPIVSPLPKEQGANQRLLNILSLNQPTPLLFDENGHVVGIAGNDSSLHQGDQALDISAPGGTKIKFPIEGIVIKVVDDKLPRDNSGLGNQIVIRSSSGDEYLFAHLKPDSIKVKVGDEVKPYQEIAQIGNTGTVLGPTGNHLHTEVTQNGVKLKSGDILKFYEAKLPPEVIKAFENKQIDDLKYLLPALNEIDQVLATDLAPGVIDIITDLLTRQAKELKELPVKVGEILKEEPLNVFGTLLKEIYSRGEDLAKSGFRQVANLDEFQTLQKELAAVAKREGKSYLGLIYEAFTEPDRKIQISPEAAEILGKLETDNTETMKALAGFLEIMPITNIAGLAVSQTVSKAVLGQIEVEEKGLPIKIGTTEGITRGVESTVGLKILDLFLPKAKVKKEVKQAEKAGIAQEDIAILAKDTGIPKEEVQNIINKAVESLKGGRQAITPMDIVAERLQEFQKQIVKQLDDAGKQIGTIAKDLPNKGLIDISPLRQKVVDQLDGLNIKVKPDNTLDFSFSDLRGVKLGADRAIIESIWKDVKDGGLVQARDALSITRSLGNELSVGTSAGELTASQGIAASFRKDLRNTLNNMSELGPVSTKYHELLDVLDQLNSKIGPEGIKGAELLKSAFGGAKSFPREILKQVSDIAKKYKIKQGENLMNYTDLAIAAERIAETPTAKAGLKEALKDTVAGSLPTKTGIFKAIFKPIKEAITGTPLSKVQVAKELIRAAPVSLEKGFQFFGKTAPISESVGSMIGKVFKAAVLASPSISIAPQQKPQEITPKTTGFNQILRGIQKQTQLAQQKQKVTPQVQSPLLQSVLGNIRSVINP